MAVFVLYVLGLLAAGCLQGAASVQRFEQQPAYTEINPGQDALLACKIFSKKGSCSWQKDNKPVGMYMHKYEWAGSQETGDCSLWIRAAQLEFDDGAWECQVTASDFTTQDALTSLPIRLVVRVPPQRPRIEFNGTQVLPGHNLTALHGEVATIKCVSHYGNPAPLLKWFLDQNEVTPKRGQTNSTELDNPRTWLAVSILELTISKENHGRTLRCVAVHESYSTRSSSTEVRLDVMFVPETRLVGIPTADVEELKDSVAVRCVVNANPRATVIWRRSGQSQPASLQELLQFSPAVRQHAGLYTCHARNQAGESSPVSVHIDVKYAPKILSVGPDRLTTALLFASATFECIGEGNPQPTYQWLQRLPTPSDEIVERGRESKLHIANVTYDYQGEYVCKVTNIIGGSERTVQSEAIALQVVGAPQVLRHSTTPEIRVEKGQSALLSLVVCADPRPRIVAWEWGSLRLEAGSEMGRYRVDEVTQDVREDCYLATLHIDDASATDSRSYYLAVENDRGTDRHAIQLYVNEPLQLSTVVSLAGGGLVCFLLLVCFCIYAIRAEKCCFARKGDFKPTDLDSEKLDIEKNSVGPGGIPADAIYTTNTRGRGNSSPEVMKHPTTLTFKGRSSLEDRHNNIYAGLENRQNVRHYKSQTLPPNYYESDDYPSDNGIETPKYERKYMSYNKYQTNQRPNVVPNDKYYVKNSIPKTEQTLPLQYGGASHLSNYQVDDNKYSRQMSLKPSNNKYSQGRDHPKQRPKPLQVNDEKYYNHIFPVRQYKPYNKTESYFQPSSIDRAEL